MPGVSYLCRIRRCNFAICFAKTPLITSVEARKRTIGSFQAVKRRLSASQWISFRSLFMTSFTTLAPPAPVHDFFYDSGTEVGLLLLTAAESRHLLLCLGAGWRVGWGNVEELLEVGQGGCLGASQ